jgi:hypothetical protein
MRRRPKRHPAQASRILTAGLSAATVLGIVAALGAQTAPAAPQPLPRPAKAVVVLHAPDTRRAAAAPKRTQRTQRTPPTTLAAARQRARSAARPAPDTTTSPS